MKYECSYNSDLNIIEAVTHGPASMPEMIDMLACIAELCAQNNPANVLVDHSELDAAPFTMEEVQKLGKLVVSLKNIFKERKCAHIAVKDIQFGLVRAWEIIIELDGFTDFHSMVFRNRTGAIEWLKTGP